MALRMNRTAASARAGFSLTEAMIVLSMVSIVLLASTEVSRGASDAFDAAARRTERELEAQRALESVVVTLTGAAVGLPGLLVPEMPPQGAVDLSGNMNGEFGASDVYFERVTAFDPATGQITAAERQQLSLRLEVGEVANGVDDDGDGLVDESELVLVVSPGAASERQHVLVRGVAPMGQGELANALDDDGDGVIDEPGFCIQRTGDLFTVQLSLQGRLQGADAPFTVDATTRTSLRN